MVDFRLLDNKTQQRITSLDVSSGLPDDVSMMIMGPLLVENSRYTMLTRILNGASRRSISEIALSSFSEESPEFLAFLVLIFNKTSSLKFSASLHGNCSFSCLMATLFHIDGIRELDISESLSIEQSKLLFTGVGASPCLEKFRLRADFENSQESANHLIEAVRKNESLCALNVSSEDFDHASFLPVLLKEVARKEGIVVFCNETEHTNDPLPVDALQDALCHKDCRLEQLWLVGIIPASDRTMDLGCLIQNSSVKGLILAQSSQMNLSTAMKAVKLFKSLETLDLSGNKISGLSELDGALLDGENPSLLQSLSLNSNRINVPAMETFARKLPRMKSLRNLELSYNPFLDSLEGRGALKVALWNSSHLERLCPVLENESSTMWSEYVTALNRAGRGPLKILAANPSSVTGLWPLILERAAKLKYYSGSDNWGEPSCCTLRADAVFWILREMMTSVLR